MKKKIACLVVAASFIICCTAIAQVNSSKTPPPPPTTEEQLKHITSKLKADLKLSDEQLIKVKEIFMEFFEIAPPPPPPPPPPVDKATFDKAKANRDAKLKQVLSKEQFTQLQELEKKHHEQGPRGEMPPPPPPPPADGNLK